MAEQHGNSPTFQITINQRQTSITTPANRTLLEVLREDLHLTGTKYGCGEGACGACTVLIDGRPALSCSTPISEVAGKSVRTIESLAGENDPLHPVQQAFFDQGAFQCGYCTAGMILATVALLERKSNPSKDEIVEALDGHLCRCCGYPRILEAVQTAAAKVAKA